MANRKRRTAILTEASKLINGAREQQYGAPQENMANIAAMWEAYTGFPIEPMQVTVMMALLKIARLRADPFNEDCFVDGAGYLALAGELADDSSNGR